MSAETNKSQHGGCCGGGGSASNKAGEAEAVTAKKPDPNARPEGAKAPTSKTGGHSCH